MFATLLAGSALLVTGLAPALAGCGSAQVMQVGALVGDPEKDTFGLDCTAGEVDRTGSLSSSPGREILQAGASMGDAEKDTFGYLRSAAAE